MSSEVIERLSAKLFDNLKRQADGLGFIASGSGRYPVLDGCFDMHELAKAAIIALLETTPEQRQAARDIPFHFNVNERNVAIYQAMLRVVLEGE